MSFFLDWDNDTVHRGPSMNVKQVNVASKGPSMQRTVRLDLGVFMYTVLKPFEATLYPIWLYFGRKVLIPASICLLSASFGQCQQEGGKEFGLDDLRRTAASHLVVVETISDNSVQSGRGDSSIVQVGEVPLSPMQPNTNNKVSQTTKGSEGYQYYLCYAYVGYLAINVIHLGVLIWLVIERPLYARRCRRDLRAFIETCRRSDSYKREDER